MGLQQTSLAVGRSRVLGLRVWGGNVCGDFCLIQEFHI
jgi:hypothetical protein